MNFKIVVCVLFFLAYTQAKPTYNNQELTNDITEYLQNFRNGKRLEKIQLAVDRLKYIMLTHRDLSKNKHLSLNTNANFTCQGYYDALNTTQELLDKFQEASSQFGEIIVDIENEIKSCENKSPFEQMACLAGKMEELSLQITSIMQIAQKMMYDVTSAYQEIIADIRSCLPLIRNPTYEEIVTLLEELLRSIMSNHKY